MGVYEQVTQGSVTRNGSDTLAMSALNQDNNGIANTDPTLPGDELTLITNETLAQQADNFSYTLGRAGFVNDNPDFTFVDDDGNNIMDTRHDLLEDRRRTLEDEVVDALATAVQESFPKLSHRYYKLKAKWYGVDQMDYWDRNAPLPEAADRRYSWDEARDTVLGAYHGFTPDMAEVAQQFFDKRWIDAPPSPGKDSGAFAHPTVPSAPPLPPLPDPSAPPHFRYGEAECATPVAVQVARPEVARPVAGTSTAPFATVVNVQRVVRGWSARGLQRLASWRATPEEEV